MLDFYLMIISYKVLHFTFSHLPNFIQICAKSGLDDSKFWIDQSKMYYLYTFYKMNLEAANLPFKLDEKNWEGPRWALSSMCLYVWGLEKVLIHHFDAAWPAPGAMIRSCVDPHISNAGSIGGLSGEDSCVGESPCWYRPCCSKGSVQRLFLEDSNAPQMIMKIFDKQLISFFFQIF